MKKVYAGATRDRREFRFHRALEQELLQQLDSYGVRRSGIKIIDLPVPKPLRVTHPMIDSMKARDYQVPMVDYMANPQQKIKVTNLQTGKGKTAISLMAMVRMGLRTVIQLRGGYVARWIDDLEGLFTYKKGDILVIRGRDALMSVINMAKADDLDAKVIIITNKTLYKFFEEFEKNPHDNYYGCRPEELYGLLRAGLRIVDEVHEDYHLSFRTDIYCNIQSSIHLSATLDTEDPFRRQMYDIALPQDCWYKGVEYDKYIISYALFYTASPEAMQKLRLSEKGQDNYSHGAYEKSILRHRDLKEVYLDVCTYPVQRFYIEDDWQGGQKCIVFCYLVEFCEVLRDHYRKLYPELSVEEYVAETDAGVLKTADIIVSTIKSAGTAQDIPDLKVAILTQAVRKKEANIQTLGRLRKLKRWPEVTPVFVYLSNSAVPAHMKYHEAKKEIFRTVTLTQRSEGMPHRL
jgi:superfamily II DNA or RNA helicase